ncbi:methyl-accepting chemotaxis protein [Paenibacillus chitinolyticus]|uniref:methyl-accepting chemotaxis protein n=1 Tax=Paenibacillus chitinolyticus TaxID=79263 RepID=UPI0036733B22
MKWYRNLKTSAKLVTAFVFIAILLVFTGFFGLFNMSKLNNNLSSMYENNLVPLRVVSDASFYYQVIRTDLRDLNDFAETPAQKDEYKNKIDENVKKIGEKIGAYEKTDVTQGEKDLLQAFHPVWDGYQKQLEEAVKVGYGDDREAFKALLASGSFKTKGDEVMKAFDDMFEINVKLAEERNAEGAALYKSSSNVTFGVMIAAFLISIGLGYAIARIISRPLNQVVGLVGKVSAGDLTEVTDIDTRDEIGQLAKSVNEMVYSLRSTVGGILTSAESVSAAAEQISASTQEIASGSVSQAGAAQTIHELFKELSTAITSVATSAEQASEVSSDALNIAQQGGKIVNSSIESMNQVNEQVSRLEEDSNKIGEIIEVIDDIAEQTNLLALNAAIEAARAGDQGRGFAVVADEVRKLAERSGEATKQITAIIKGMQENTRQSVKAVGDGVVLSRQTGESFHNIIGMVNESANKVMEIAAASEQQAAQSSEVMSSIESISAVTEQSAASSEETASTAQSLAGLAEELNRTVAVFKISKSA